MDQERWGRVCDFPWLEWMLWVAFSALMLLVGWNEWHLACKTCFNYRTGPSLEQLQKGRSVIQKLSAAGMSLGVVMFLCYVFSKRELARYMLSPVRLSSVCLSSVTFVRPTQAVQIFGNISTALGTLAIRGQPLKILRRSSQGNPSAGGVKDKRGSQIQRFRTYGRLYLGNVQDRR